MRLTAIGIATVLLASCAAMGAEAEAGWTTLWNESFDNWEIGNAPAITGGWQAHADGENRVEVAAVEHGRAVCLLDVVNAPRNASCRLRRRLPGYPGEYRISYRTMLRQGRAKTLGQDMGLHLFDPAVLFDVFFSGGALKTWQEAGWTPLEPSVVWEADRWYRIEIEVSPAKGTAVPSVDGRPRRAVKLRHSGVVPTMLEFVSQRYAQGELWVDDVKVEHRWPPELRSRPGAKWHKATPDKRHRHWFADEGSVFAWGKLRNGEGQVAVARRGVAADFTTNPVLQLDLKPSPGVSPSLYLRRNDTDETVALPPASDQRYALFAATGWDGPVDAELLVAIDQPGEVALGSVEIDEQEAVDYRDPAAIGRFVRPSRARNRLPDALLLEVQGTPGQSVPVHFGVPFAPGMVSRPDSLSLRDGAGTPLPLQTRPLSYWPDGTVRWLLMDTLAPVGKLGAGMVALSDGRDEGTLQPPIGHQTESSVKLDNGLIHLSISRQGRPHLVGIPAPCDGLWDLVVRADKEEFHSILGDARAYLEETGPVRATAVIAGTLGGTAGNSFEYELRVTLVQGRSELEIRPTFVFVGDSSECQLEEASLRLGTAMGEGEVTFGMDPPVICRRAGEQSVRLLQDQLDHFAVHAGDTAVKEGKRAAGWVLADGLCVAVRRFPEQFRKGFVVSDKEVAVQLWAPGGSRRFGRGAAKTHALMLGFGVAGGYEAAAMAARNETPASLFPGAKWLAHVRGLGRFPVPGDATHQLDTLYETACQRRITERDRRPDRSYGMVDYGETNHINSEIDAHVALYLEWARTGKRKWLDPALDWALHSQDIDVCHFSPNAREVGIHHNHYPSDHNNGGLTLTHTWIRGQLFRYYLLGDQRSLLAAERAGLAYRRSMLPNGQLFDGGKPGAGIGSRGYGRACWALAELYQATGNPFHLETMGRLNGYLIANLRPDGAVGGNHNGAGTWSTTDECPHMAAICAVGLARYAALLPRKEAQPYHAALRRIADWQLARGAMPEKLGVMYHSYPGGEVIHFVDATSDMLEAWIALYEATSMPIYRDMAESIYDNMIEMGDQWRHDWTMCARNVLFYMADRQRLPQAQENTLLRAPAGADAAFLTLCQNKDGGFGLAPGLPSDMDSTYRALDALRLLGQSPPAPQECARWILSCRHECGGYAVEPGWHANVAWTCLALRSLSILSVPPPDRQLTIDWLRSCFQEEGGCGSSFAAGPVAYHPAWRPTTDYTSYAVQALAALGSGPPDIARTRSFLLARQSERGGFNNRSGRPTTPYTALALDALRRLPRHDDERRFTDGVLAWLVALRMANGGYSCNGQEPATLRNTEHVLRSFRSLQFSLSEKDLELTRAFVASCRAATGGFGHRPGRTPTVLHTWYGVRAAAMLAPRRPDAR